MDAGRDGSLVRALESALATLEWIHRAPEVRASYLVEALEISSQGVGHLVSQLEREGLILREKTGEIDERRGSGFPSSGHAGSRSPPGRAAMPCGPSFDCLPRVLLPRLTRIAELILGALAEEPAAALHGCRFCDWTLCRSDLTAPCPVVLAEASHAGNRRAQHTESLPSTRSG